MWNRKRSVTLSIVVSFIFVGILTAALFLFCSFILFPPIMFYKMRSVAHSAYNKGLKDLFLLYKKIEEGQVTPPRL